MLSPSAAPRSNRELWFALLAAALITAIYALFVSLTRQVPAAGSLFGHLIGVAGFLLMLATELLYSFRKRSRRAFWGSMAAWLRFHIFTGLLGPYMVLLHTSWKFNGLAGATMLLTILIVVSGFIGRYLYTRIPRTMDGIQLDTVEGLSQAVGLLRLRRLFSIWHAIHIPIGMALFTASFIHIGAALYYATLLH
jgi:hypothetical protein